MHIEVLYTYMYKIHVLYMDLVCVQCTYKICDRVRENQPYVSNVVLVLWGQTANTGENIEKAFLHLNDATGILEFTQQLLQVKSYPFS